MNKINCNDMYIILCTNLKQEGIPIHVNCPLANRTYFTMNKLEHVRRGVDGMWVPVQSGPSLNMSVGGVDWGGGG